MTYRGSWAKMYRGNAPSPSVQTSWRMERIGTEWADAFGRIALEAFEMPAVLLPFMSCQVGKPGWFHYLGFDGDQPVSTAAMHISADVGWLGVGSTGPPPGSRRAVRHVSPRRISDGLEAGCKWFVTETGEDTPKSPNPSYRNMLRAGFKLAYLRPNYVHGEQ